MGWKLPFIGSVVILLCWIAGSVLVGLGTPTYNNAKWIDSNDVYANCTLIKKKLDTVVSRGADYYVASFLVRILEKSLTVLGKKHTQW